MSPAILLERRTRTKEFFNTKGKAICLLFYLRGAKIILGANLPRGEFKDEDQISYTPLETGKGTLQGDEKSEVLRFVRGVLQWRPEDHASAAELITDPWIKR